MKEKKEYIGRQTMINTNPKNHLNIELQPQKVTGNKAITEAQAIVNGFREQNEDKITVTSYSDAVGQTAIYLQCNFLFDHELYSAFQQYHNHIDREKKFRLRVNEGDL